MIDLDRASLDRVLPATPGPADWGDVMSRFRASRSSRRRRVVMLAAATLVAVVGSASAIGGVRDFVLHRGFIGLPPSGATPSAPESGELVLRWEGASVSHANFAETLVYADGRMIWQRDGLTPQDPLEPSGYLEQRLTPQAVEHLRSEVAGLLAPSRALLETVPADHNPLQPFGRLTLFVPRDYGSGFGSVEVRDGDRFVRLRWLHPDDPRPGPPNTFKGTIATPEQVSALRRIDALLTDPTSVLPSSAWAVRDVRAYVPSHYAVCISSSTSKDASQLLSLLPARGAELLGDESWTRTWPNPYCAKLTTDEAREVANAVSGLPRHPWGLTLMYVIAKADSNSNPTTIQFDPYLPHGRFLLGGGGR